jgi:hypothetical protein
MLLLILFSYTIPIDSPMMDNIEYLQIKRLIDIPSMKPYEIEWLMPQIDELVINETQLNPIDRKIVSYFNLLFAKDMKFSHVSHFNTHYEREPVLYYGFVDFRLGGRLTNGVSYSQALRVRAASEIDSLGPQPWKDFQTYLHEGFITLNVERIKFTIGRRNYLLQPHSEHSLLLSLDPQGYDGYILRLPSRYYEFYTIFAVLDASEQRYLSVHRISLNLKNFLTLGFSESILFGNSLEPLYFNFFLPYYVSQWGLDRNDNIMWSFDAQVVLFNSIIYGELLIDDFQYEDDPYPNKLSYQCGLKSLLLNTLLMKLNYTRVDKWVYTHHVQINTYQRNSHPLGFPLGNDVDKVTFSLKFMNRYSLNPSVTLQYVRKGEGSIFLPYEEEGGTWTPSFPSGTVEQTLDISCGLDYTVLYNFYIKAGFGKRFLYNYNHVSGDDKNEFLFNISVWAIL